MQVRQAVFLVGGKGTRLGALTKDIPKPLLEVAPGVRFLDVVLEGAARQGFDDIVLLAGHLGEQVEAAYHGRSVRGVRVEVIREPSPQGTGGALAFARERLADWFVMGNGDSLFEINLRALAMRPDDSFDGRLALRMVDDPARYGAVALEDGTITAFHEKSAELKGPALINGGLYLLRRDAALELISGPTSIEQDVFPVMAAGGRLRGAQFDGYFLDIGLPDTYAQAQEEVWRRRIRPAAFLDRDGVLNVDKGYTHRPEDLELVDGAAEMVRLLNDAGRYVIVVTNQAGVGRGYYTEDNVDAFHAALSDRLAEEGAYIDAFYFCPFHADATVDRYRHADHPDRKPNPGMLLKALKDWPIERKRSFLIGDKPSDVAAAEAAQVRGWLFEGGELPALAARALRESGG